MAKVGAAVRARLIDHTVGLSIAVVLARLAARLVAEIGAVSLAPSVGVVVVFAFSELVTTVAVPFALTAKPDLWRVVGVVAPYKRVAAVTLVAVAAPTSVRRSAEPAARAVSRFKTVAVAVKRPAIVAKAVSVVAAAFAAQPVV